MIAPDAVTSQWLAGRPTPRPPVRADRLLALRPSPAAAVTEVAGHPVLVHPSGRVFAADLGATVAVVEGAGLVVTWAELDASAVSEAALRAAVRAAFRQAGRMAGADSAPRARPPAAPACGTG